MSDPVLTTASSLSCGHGGRLAVHTAQHLLTVDGTPVLLITDLAGTTITGCTTITNPNATPPTKQCMTVTSVIGGAARTLSVSGTPVATAQAHGLTDGIAGGPGTWQVTDAGQTKLVTS